MLIYDNKGAVLLDIEVDDTSVRYKAIKGENSLTLKFSLSEHIEVPIGSYCSFKGETYTLMLPEDLTLNHRRSFEYTLVMYSDDAKAKRYKFVNPVDRRLKFSLTAKPVEHLQMFVDNMNMRDGGWSVGECPDHVEIVLSYNHTFCHDALVQLANELDVDYWFSGKTVNLGKLELNKSNPLPLSYGGDGEGLKPNIKRTNFSEALPLEVLYVQGGATNIDASKYGSSELHLPKAMTIGFDGEHFDDEAGYDASKARQYKTDTNGFYVVRADKEVVNHSEDSLDCSDIQPTKKETIKSVVLVDAEKHFYDILFESDVDYKQYVIGGENASIVFQSGMLAGKEFDLATDENGNLVCKKDGGNWRVEIVPQDIDGITMPDNATGYVPVVGDEFKIFGIQLPDEYVADSERDMLKYAVKHFSANEDVQYTISGELDEIYAKRNWGAISERLTLGNYVSFSDKSFQAEPILIRIVGIKEYVNKPYSPILEISNAAIAGSLVGTLNRIENEEVRVDDKFNEAKRYTKRSFARVKETMSMIEAAVEGFSAGIDPVILQTMAIGVGKESLQFAFIKSLYDDAEYTPNFSFDEVNSIFSAPESVLMHYTIDINAISSSFDKGAYRKWTINAFKSEPLLEGEKAYYLYARVLKSGDIGDFFLTQDPQPFDEDYLYNLLVGVLNTEFNGFRTFVPLYGFTEILPGQITTDVIRSADGSCVFDLRNNTITGAVKLLPGTSGLENIEGLSEAVQGAVGGIEFGKYNLLRNSGFTGDFVTESLDTDKILNGGSEMFSDPLDHWTLQNGAIEASKFSQSGYECVLNDGTLKQEMVYKTIAGENYVLSFRGRGTSLTFSVGGVTKDITLSESQERYIEKFVASNDSNLFEIKNATGAICEIQLERGNIVSDWGYSMWDNKPEISKFQTLQHLLSAIYDGSTSVVGGLILSNALLLGNPKRNDNTAGVSGIYSDDIDVAFWAGGNMNQAINAAMMYYEDPSYQPTDAEVASMAKAVITHGGRAILNDAVIRGMIYAKGGVFSGIIRANGGQIGNIIIDVNPRTGEAELTSRDICHEGRHDYSRFTSDGFFAESTYNSIEGSCMMGNNIEVTGMGLRSIRRSRNEQLFNYETSNGKETADVVIEHSKEGGFDGTETAFKANSGMFEGLRPKTKVITTSVYIATEFDHSMIVNSTSGDCRIWLDTELDGQEYFIESRGARVTLISNNSEIFYHDSDLAQDSTYALNGKGIIRLKFYQGLGWTAKKL